jgi:hypothetical protein
MPENYVDLDAAAAAAKELFDIGKEPDEEPEDVEEQSEVVEEAEASTAEDETTETPAEPEVEDEDFIPRADLEALLEGLEGDARESVITAYKSFQRLSTKQSQDSAALRRAFDGVDPKEARQAYDFVQNLGSDPQFAMQVHKELSDALESAGMSPAAAAREATTQIEEAVTETGALDEYEDNPFVQELNELKRWRASQEAAAKAEAEGREQRERQDAMLKDIERQDQEIRRANPKISDDDMEAIYKVAASTGGDLLAAKDFFDGLKDRLVTDYVASKKRVPAGAGGGHSVGAGTSSEQPVVINDIDQGHKLAVERARHLLSGD